MFLSFPSEVRSIVRFNILLKVNLLGSSVSWSFSAKKLIFSWACAFSLKRIQPKYITSKIIGKPATVVKYTALETAFAIFAPAVVCCASSRTTAIILPFRVKGMKC